MSTPEFLMEVDAWKQCWLARLDRGFGGPITPAEDGNKYGDAMVVSGELVRQQENK